MARAGRRVVVTGLGLVTPLGTGVATSWKRLIEGESGLVSLRGIVHAELELSYEGLPSQVAGLVPRAHARDGTPDATHSKIPNDVTLFHSTDWVPKSDNSRTSPFMHYAFSAVQQALDDSRWSPLDEAERERTGVCIGSGIGCIEEVAQAALTLKERGLKRLSPFFVPRTLVNMAAGNISIRYGFQGPNHAVSTACATGAHAIGDAMRFIQYGDADVMIAGGTEASVSPLAVAGFCKSKSLATSFNDSPTEASRPFDLKRDGFVIGEGCGVVVLEELEHARRRGAKIYAELAGYGLTGDANHITSPPEDGNGAARSMLRALQVAGLSLEDVDYVNAHATSTHLGDLAETRAICRVFGERTSPVAVSSTKGAIGHLLGAAGAVEAIFTILAVHHGIIPPTLNLRDGGDCQDVAGRVIDFVHGVSRQAAVRAAITNSFGFGGTNASLLFSKM